MYHRHLLFLGTLLLISALIFVGCEKKQIEPAKQTDSSVKESSTYLTTDAPSTNNEIEEVSHHFIDKKLNDLEKPLKATVISTLSLAMDKEPVNIAQSEIDILLDLFNSMDIECFDYNKSTIPVLYGGGYQIKLYYEDANITIIVYNEDHITIQNNQGIVEHYADTSSTNETFNKLIGELAGCLS